jgi:hypothetical protein
MTSFQGASLSVQYLTVSLVAQELSRLLQIRKESFREKK